MASFAGSTARKPNKLISTSRLSAAKERRPASSTDAVTRQFRGVTRQFELEQFHLARKRTVTHSSNNSNNNNEEAWLLRRSWQFSPNYWPFRAVSPRTVPVTTGPQRTAPHKNTKKETCLGRSSQQQGAIILRQCTLCRKLLQVQRVNCWFRPTKY